MSNKVSNYLKLTTTDKLYLAIAYETYGPDNIEKIDKYLSFNNVHISKIPTLFQRLTSDAISNGYASAKEYCEDLRYNKALHEYEKYKNLIYAVLENSIDLDSIVIPEYEIISVDKSTSLLNNTVTVVQNNDFIIEQIPKLDINFKDQPQIEPKTLNKICKIKVESPKNNKEKKKFYLKMDENERLLDDYFDYLDISHIEDNKNLKNLDFPNNASKKYPLVIEEEEKRNKKLTKTLCLDEFTKRKKTEILELQTPFELLMHKIQTTKRQDKNKALWKPEIKCIMDYIAPIFELEEKFKEVSDNLDNYSMQYSVMSLMLIIQDCVMEEEDEEVLESYSEYKRMLAAFCDYYRK